MQRRMFRVPLESFWKSPFLAWERPKFNTRYYKKPNTVSAGSSLTLSLLLGSFTFLLSEFTSTRSVVSVVLSPWLAAPLRVADQILTLQLVTIKIIANEVAVE